MKQLLTLCLVLMSVTAMAQWPSLPYNPDENGDGLIGVVDLAALLAQYNTEFASAVVSEDGESAIVYMGDLGYFECEYSCNQLPGFWTLPSAADLVPVFPELNVYLSGGGTQTWLNKSGFEGTSWNRFPYLQGHSNTSSRFITENPYYYNNYRCYCAAKQLPRVEYSVCGMSDSYNVNASHPDMTACCAAKVADGWLPLGGPNESDKTVSQAFWRWAE